MTPPQSHSLWLPLWSLFVCPQDPCWFQPFFSKTSRIPLCCGLLEGSMERKGVPPYAGRVYMAPPKMVRQAKRQPTSSPASGGQHVQGNPLCEASERHVTALSGGLAVPFERISFSLWVKPPPSIRQVDQSGVNLFSHLDTLATKKGAPLPLWGWSTRPKESLGEGLGAESHRP